METRAEVLTELRAMFREGATPSRLIRHIADRHAGDDDVHLLVQFYFVEAFGVPIVRGLNPVDRFDHDDLRYAFLNEYLVHEIIQRRSEWDAPSDRVPSESDSWLDSLKATDAKDRISQIHGDLIPELSRCWSHLTPQERYYIQMCLGSANGLSETVKALSRLAECLQQRVIELEAACAPALAEGD